MADYDLVIVGGGVAALTAGLFGARHGHSTLVLVADIPGGHLANIDKIEDFPGFPEGIAGYELGPKLQEQAANAGADFRMAQAQRLEPTAPLPPRRERLGEGTLPSEWLISTSDGGLTAKAVVVATGSRPRKLGIPGEERFEGRGLSHCASCDGPLLRGGPAVVVGGGDSAFMEALTLAEHASEVTIVHKSHAARAQDSYQRRVSDHPKIAVRPGAIIEELLGEDALSGVRVGRDTLPAAGVWVYVGLEPNTAWLQDTLRLDGSGHIPTDTWLQTELTGVFAAGDVRADSASQAIAAAGDGATAAIAAHRYLLEQPNA